MEQVKHRYVRRPGSYPDIYECSICLVTKSEVLEEQADGFSIKILYRKLNELEHKDREPICE